MVRREVHRIYSEYEPGKYNQRRFNMDKIISEYAGREFVLYGEVCKEHGITPKPLAEEASAVVAEAVKW